MFLSVLLLLLVCRTQASHFYGTMMTYYPKETRADGSMTVNLRYKLNFQLCTESDSWVCGGNCGNATQSLSLTKVEESSNEWCQNEGILTHQVPDNSPLQLVLAGGNWINGIINGIVSWRAVTAVELRNRSDTGRPNASPQSTVLPSVRVPSNCQRNLSLLNFDPDGDEVKCRYGNTSQSECNPCTPPSVLSLSSSCTLSFSPTNTSSTGPYAVQLVMEDFPRQNIVLTQTNGSQVLRTTSDAISRIPLQFVLQVVPPVPSCSEGQYLPRFLPPTPENRAQLYTPVNRTLEILIRAEATQSQVSQLLFSGPYNVVKGTSGSGSFTLRWTPSGSEDGQSHPICFVVQATSNGTLFDSELRCVTVTVGNPPPVTVLPPTTTTSLTAAVTTKASNFSTPVPGPNYIVVLKVKISTTLSLQSDSDTLLKQIKDELIRQGLPSNITLRLLSNGSIQVTTAAP